jgi:hypothetical protein
MIEVHPVMPADLTSASAFAWDPKLDPAAFDLRWSPSEETAVLQIKDDWHQAVDLSPVPARRIQLIDQHPHFVPALPSGLTSYKVGLPLLVDRLDLYLASAEGCALEFTSSMPQALTVEVIGSGSPARFELANLQVQHLRLSNVSVKLLDLSGESGPRARTVDSIRLRNASLAVGRRTVKHLNLEGDCAVDGARARIGTLLARSGALLAYEPGDEPATRLGAARAPGMSLDDSVDLVLKSGTLTVQEAEEISVVLSSGSNLVVTKLVKRIAVQGPGSLELMGSGLDVRFRGVEPEAAGPVVLRDVRFSSISGVPYPPRAGSPDSRRFTLAGIGDDVTRLAGVSLTDVVIPVDLRGLQTISALQEQAALISPALHPALPGETKRVFSARLPLSTRSIVSLPQSATWQIQAQYSRLLSELANSKQAPASVRTRLGWNAYYLRNITAPGQTERVVLGLYRLIGYGERVLPSALTYALLALAMTVVRLNGQALDISLNGFTTWLTAYLNWLATPVHLLNLTRDDKVAWSFQQPWDTLARLIVAVPFGTGVLALRKYVKATR